MAFKRVPLADHERDWPPCRVVFFGLSTITLNVLCMVINIRVQYNGGLLPDIILLLTQGYCQWGTRLNTM